MQRIGQGVHWVEGKVGDGLTYLTGSQTFGDAVAPTATQGILAAAPKVPGALRTTGRVVKQTAEVLRNLEVTLDSSALLRHSAGIPIDAIKIRQKTPKVDVPAATTEGATAATVSEAPVLAKDQPWTVRPGQEYKLKVHGQAQVTGPGHEVRSYRVAIEEAKKADTVRVHLDQGYKKVTGVDVKPNRRHDVTIVKEDGTVHATEVVSKTDVRRELIKRNEEAIAQLPEQMRGDINLVDYTRSHQVPTKGGE